MEVAFPEVGFSPKEKDEIDEILYRISVGNESGMWRSRPDEIRILSRLSGGRSGSEVLEVVVKRGNDKARKVIKLGPGYDLENEFKAFDNYLRDASTLFVRIEAGTPVVLGRALPRRGEREAVVYDHAARFQGMPQNQTQTFEEIAREAIRYGGPTLEKTIEVLQTLFDGIRNDLYDKKQRVYDQETTLQKSWNRRLGIDAVVAIDHFDPSSKTLETFYRPPYGAKQETFKPRGIASASIRVDGEIATGDILQVSGAKMTWQDDRLVAEENTHYLRIQVRSDKISVDQLIPLFKEEPKCLLRGELVSLRMKTHRERLLNGLGIDFKLAEGMLTGTGARVPDPFAALPIIMESSRPHRITSVVHGDLNPRNILVINETPCLIDYALTRADEPIFMDFARLEGCLARDILPSDFTWAQHVRLQRLLAAACRLGEESVQRFAERLAADRVELASAFRLLWTIRRAARDVYPKKYQDQWVRDYLEQLFLFAHLTLKWDSGEELVPQKLLVTAAITGVAAEALTNRDIYELWSTEALREDGGEIIQVVQSRPEAFLSELANLARVWYRLNRKQDTALQEVFEQARVGFVKRRFHDAANEIINQLRREHEVYISLRAYIDLKGQLSRGFPREKRPLGGELFEFNEFPSFDELPSFEKILKTDELFAESEFLRAPSGPSQDVLSLITKNPAMVLIGDAGSGKSTVVREWEYYLARSIVDQDKTVSVFEGHIPTNRSSLEEQTIQLWSSEVQGNPPHIEPRMPIVLRAPDLAKHLQNWNADDPQSTVSVLGHDKRDMELLTIGALYVIIDALNELADEQKQRIANWIIALRKAFLNTPILVCHRQYNYVPSLLPFPVVTMQKVEIEQARRYIHDYLREKDVPNHEQLAHRLGSLLLDDPDYAQVRDLAQTPLFLWMIVVHYEETGDLPQSRGSLFESFSRSYLEQRYHKIPQEMIRTKYSYEDKALLLGALGYELVQRNHTDLPEKDVPRLVPRGIKSQWQDILEEIIAAEMLFRDGKHLRFLHQSFQEYFAARHFLKTGAKTPASIRRKVSQFGWQDTFAMLLGFAGDAPEVVTQIIEEALKVNPLLTARCLRMAEQPDPLLLERFVASQEATLKNAHAGEFAHQRAAEALAEYGRDQARAVLWRVAIIADAPEMARVEALKRLAAMPAQVRFEPVKEWIRQELESNLPQIFDEPAPVMVQQAAIDTIVTAQLRNLDAHLADLVASGEWPLRWGAWQACIKLGLKLTRRQQAAFTTACRERLVKLEEELFQEAVVKRMDELNTERVHILHQLTTPANLPLLLKRRFSYAIHDEVEWILDELVHMDGEPPTEAQDAWTVLTEQSEDVDAAIDRWLELLRGPDDLTAIAAAHRLMQLAKKIPNRWPSPFSVLPFLFDQPFTAAAPNDLLSSGKALPCERLRQFFDPDLPPERLSAVALLAAACLDKNLAEPLEALVRSLMKTISSPKEFEALANLVDALQGLDRSLGIRILLVAESTFRTRNNELRQHNLTELWHMLFFPWRNVSYFTMPQAEDYQVLLAASDDVRLAVYSMASEGATKLLDARESFLQDEPLMRQLQNLAKDERDPKWKSFFAEASVFVHAVDLLPWLICLTDAPEMVKVEFRYSITYGAINESQLSFILRAIGYLTRVLLNDKRAEEAKPAVAFLRERYAALQPDEERSIVVGLTTGLGYLGDWEPILIHLGPGELWMHQAAQNVFEYWVPTPLNKASAKKQREEAAIWIARRLRDCSDLSPQARSTLERIKNDLETQLGRHIQLDDV